MTDNHYICNDNISYYIKHNEHFLTFYNVMDNYLMKAGKLLILT